MVENKNNLEVKISEEISGYSEDKNKPYNIQRREFLKKMVLGIFVVPTIQSFQFLQSDNNRTWWTGHHHGGETYPGHYPPLPPPKPKDYNP
ncbi:MAG: hypothetical protein ABIC91_08075 [Nanoarchaeota archaeon]|nr:hypothetical protein [Nanoarchaeota archaeon]MBU1031043.1 hypothetical protein [Nanoarchaeota archaeon]MBU1850384.1 hypothetical protein [Nanoarchaeota archaeon]